VRSGRVSGKFHEVVTLSVGGEQEKKGPSRKRGQQEPSLEARDSMEPLGNCALSWYLDCTYRTWRCDMEVEEAVLPYNATMLSTWPSKYSTRCAGQGQQTQAPPSKSRSSKREPPSSCPSGSCGGSHGGSPGGFWIHPH
jgi:hypothetical protein